MDNNCRIFKYDSCSEAEQDSEVPYYHSDIYQNDGFDVNNQQEQQEDYPRIQFDDSSNVSTNLVHRRQQRTSVQTQLLSQASVVSEQTIEPSSKPSNNTKNFPSQMGRLIINHLKKKSKKNTKLNLKVPTNLGGVNKLICNEGIRPDVVEFFEGNHILFQILSSPKILNVSNVIEAFAPYHHAFKTMRNLENQTW